MSPSASPVPLKNFWVVPNVASFVPSVFFKSIPPLLKTTCVSISSIAPWAVDAAAVALFALDIPWPAELDTVFNSLATEDETELRFAWASPAEEEAALTSVANEAETLVNEPLIASASWAEPLTKSVGSPAEISLPAVIVIWPATCTFVPSNLI